MPADDGHAVYRSWAVQPEYVREEQEARRDDAHVAAAQKHETTVKLLVETFVPDYPEVDGDGAVFAWVTFFKEVLECERFLAHGRRCFEAEAREEGAAAPAPWHRISSEEAVQLVQLARDAHATEGSILATLTAEQVSQVSEAAHERWSLRFFGRPRWRALIGRPLLRHMVATAALGAASLHAAHDYTVLCLLAALGFTKYPHPTLSYGAYVVLEFYRAGDGAEAGDGLEHWEVAARLNPSPFQTEDTLDVTPLEPRRETPLWAGRRRRVGDLLDELDRLDRMDRALTQDSAGHVEAVR